MKICTKCNIEKDFLEYSKNKKSKDGLQHFCKSCMSEISQKYKDKQYSKKWRENNPEKEECVHVLVEDVKQKLLQQL